MNILYIKGIGMGNSAVNSWYKQLKRDLCCKRCNFKHEAVIEFHHRDANKKHYTISQMVHNGMDITLIKQELELCDPLCSNCHRIVHFNINNNIIDPSYP